MPNRSSAVGSSTPSRSVDVDLPDLVVPGPHSNVMERITQIADALPDHVAVEGPDGSLTYGELAGRALALSAELSAESARGGTGSVRRPVAVLAEQGADSIAAMLGVVASGHPCELLDVLLPEARLGQIAELADV